MENKSIKIVNKEDNSPHYSIKVQGSNNIMIFIFIVIIVIIIPNSIYSSYQYNLKLAKQGITDIKKSISGTKETINDFDDILKILDINPYIRISLDILIIISIIILVLSFYINML